MFKNGNIKENLMIVSVFLIVIALIACFIWLIISLFLPHPSSANVNISYSDISSISSLSNDQSESSSSYYTLDDIYDVEGNYIPEADSSPVISANEDGNYIISSDIERYITDKDENKIMWIKKVNFKPEKGETTLRLSIMYNYSAKNISIKVISPDGSLYTNEDSIDNIFYTSTSSMIWEFSDALQGEYQVEINGKDIYEYDVRIK